MNKKAVTILSLILLSLVRNVSAAPNLKTFLNDAGMFDPEKGSISITYELLTDTEKVEIQVKDFQGKTVGCFDYVNLRAGDQTLTWDGDDSDGKRLPDGRYQLMLEATFADTSREIARIDVRIATIDSDVGLQAPEPLPPETYPHKISGSFATFVKHNEENTPSTNGEVRLRTDFQYETENSSSKGVVAAIKDFNGNKATFNGTQANFEQRWTGGKVKGVFRDSLGNFDDPLQLFSDFKTERNKLGINAGQTVGNLNALATLFTSEGEVDSKEQGGAARIYYATNHDLKIGVSYTLRRAVQDEDETDTTLNSDDESRKTEHAYGVDLQIPLFESFLILTEFIGTEDQDSENDTGYIIKGEYDFGQLRLAAGYINLGEKFSAPFSDPLRGVESDAAGLEASVDYFVAHPVIFLRDISASVRYHALTQHSNDEKIQEVDSSLRFGLGEKDTLFFNLFKNEDEYGSNLSTIGSLSHNWNKQWSTSLRTNLSETESSNSVRVSLDTSYKIDDRSARFEIDWMEREIDQSTLSPYKESNLRIDLKNLLWNLQLQGKYSTNKDESGLNFFGKLEYKPVFLHRYNLLTYVSIGSRSATEFEEQIEVGVEVQF